VRYLITGTSRGVGRALAAGLVARGDPLERRKTGQQAARAVVANSRGAPAADSEEEEEEDD
jgi:NAD(P)-dependent dehydrogenase (short-subunit alcohol dehydrogenase family)